MSVSFAGGTSIGRMNVCGMVWQCITKPTGRGLDESFHSPVWILSATVAASGGGGRGRVPGDGAPERMRVHGGDVFTLSNILPGLHCNLKSKGKI